MSRFTVCPSRTRWVSGLLVTGALACSGSGATPGQPAEAGGIDKIFARYDRATSPGCAVGVIQGGQLIYTHGYGSENLDYGLPLSDSSTFYMASVSKQFTAASVALAARAGKLSLDDDVRKWIPELPTYGTTITVRQLVHHTSGIRDYLGLLPLAGRRLEDVHPDSELLTLITRQKALDFTPGTQYSYSNSGYLLLSVIIKRATGQSLREYAGEHIFTPLGMHHTHFHDEPLHPIANRAIGYDRTPDSTFAIDYFWNFDKVGDGGLYSTVRDMYLWDQNFYHDKLGGGPGFIDSLTKSDVLPNGEKTNYAFGLVPGEYRGLRTVEHGGSFMGYRTEILRFPEQNFSTVVLCNIAEADPASLSHQVSELYLGKQMSAPLVSTPAASSTSAPAASGDVSGIASVYWNEKEGTILEVSTSGSDAFVAFGETKLPLLPVGPHDFRLGVDQTQEFVFEPTAAGQPGKLHLKRGTHPEVVMPAVQFQHPSAADQHAYVGRYHSDELSSTYIVAIDGDHLTLQAPAHDPVPLQSPGPDVFVARARGTPPLVARFARGGGAVRSLTLSAGRIHGITFQKQ